MKWIEIPEGDFFDESKEEFIHSPGYRFKIEHSLVSLAKWESKWKLPFLHTKLNRSQWLDYVRCMTITQNVDPIAYRMISKKMLKEIQDYVNESQTATTIKDNTPYKQHRREIVTAEIIYFWMVSYNIPVEFEKWHLSRLMTLIEVCSIKNNTSGKKMTKSEILRENNRLNNARRAAYGTRG